MTQLERWAEDAAEKYGNSNDGSLKDGFLLGFKEGFQAAVDQMAKHIEPCPPGCNCPDCGASLIDESITD